MIWLLFLVCAGLAAYGSLGRKQDRTAVLLISLGLLLAAGFRQGGFDYEEYLTTIEHLRRTGAEEVELEIRLLVAKDPVMLIIADLSAMFSEESWPVFLGFALLAVFGKLLAAWTLPGGAALFLALYTVFLSPGLEFAAIRAAAAVGLLLPALALQRRLLKFPLMAAATAAHISAALPAVLSVLAPWLRRRELLMAAVFGTMLVTLGGASSFQELERGEDFANNQGTLGALAFPLATLVILAARLWTQGSVSRNMIYPVVGLCLGVSMGLAMPAVTVSFRFLELAWCLFVWALCNDIGRAENKPSKQLSWLVMSALLLLLSASNIVRATWSMALFSISY